MTLLNPYRFAAAGGGFSPDDLTGLVQWLQADAIEGLSDADDVATWTATIGNNATQATVGDRPHYKTAIANGLPVVRFAARGGYSSSTVGYNDGESLTFAGVGADLTNYTILVVGRPVNSNIGTYLTQDAAGFNDDFLFGVNPEGGFTTADRYGVVVQRDSDDSRAIASDTTAPDTTDFEIVGVRYDGTALELLRNSVTAVASDTESPLPIGDGTWQIGRNANGDQRYLNGDIAEVLIYNDDLGDSDLSTLLTYLADKWGITL